MNDVWLRASCELSFNVTMPTAMVFMLRPRSTARQWVASEKYQLEPALRVDEYTDSFSNLCQRLVAPVGDFFISTEAEVLVAPTPPGDVTAGFDDVSNLPQDVYSYLLPSRYCESDRFGAMAQELVAGCQPGYAQVQAIVAWVQENIAYVPLSSTYPVSAVEVNARREGVCRDLAQVCIALCRAMCIPARLVVGYLHQLEPMDVHAWFEVYVGGRWHTFDPTCNPELDARIAIAQGRDAADVALYNQFGPLLLPQHMAVTVERLEHK
jgi:transglutaminase-like putative cysteine protease